MLTIDGSQGEGGGQVLRTSLALSMVSGNPLRLTKIRQRRSRPGLQRQHLTAVRAAMEICAARVTGDSVGSQELTFIPDKVVTGDYTFAIGTAGSTTLVLQTILPALMCSSGPSHLVLEGGTHNPLAPPFDYLDRVYLPLVRRMGPQVFAKLERHGFFPAGGGRFVVDVEPAQPLRGFSLLDRGPVVQCQAIALLSRLPAHIAQRELQVIGRELDLPDDVLHVREVHDALGPGNAVMIEIVCGHVTELFVGFGQRGVPAERVAQGVVAEARDYLSHDVAAGEHLADQLLLPLSLAGGGEFTTRSLSSHATTQIALIPLFLDVYFEVETRADNTVIVRVS